MKPELFCSGEYRALRAASGDTFQCVRCDRIVPDDLRHPRPEGDLCPECALWPIPLEDEE